MSLANLVLDREALPEAVFAAATPPALAQHLRTLLFDKHAAAAQRVRGCARNTPRRVEGARAR